VSGRTYLSIGDVLALLRQEFPDVTISKIRFLESQGLVNPERTPSGYRKFYEHDVDRLRWVLRQQREHFLPLKVIKGRLEQEVPDGGEGNGHETTHEDVSPAGAGARRSEPVLVGGAAARLAAEPATTSGAGRAPRDSAHAPGTPRSTEPPAARPARTASSGRGMVVSEGRAGGVRPEPAATDSVSARHTSRHPSGGGSQTPLHASAVGLDPDAVAELESYGLISGRVVGGVEYYDEDALIVARLAAGFAGFGVEARHLRLHKHAAEREAGFVEQVVLPLLKQRNPESRQRAHAASAELARLGQQLREVLLRTTLRDQLGG
jgi:DNA-binding transcriptional MerR regulator